MFHLRQTMKEEDYSPFPIVISHPSHPYLSCNPGYALKKLSCLFFLKKKCLSKTRKKIEAETTYSFHLYKITNETLNTVQRWTSQIMENVVLKLNGVTWLKNCNDLCACNAGNKIKFEFCSAKKNR